MLKHPKSVASQQSGPTPFQLWEKKVAAFAEKCGVTYQHYDESRKKWSILVGDTSSGKSSLINAMLGVSVRPTGPQAIDEGFTILEVLPEAEFQKLLEKDGFRGYLKDWTLPDETDLSDCASMGSDPRYGQVYYKLSFNMLLTSYAPELSDVEVELKQNMDFIDAVVINAKFIPQKNLEFWNKNIVLDSPGLSDMNKRGPSFATALSCCIHFFQICSFIAVLISDPAKTSPATLESIKFARTTRLGSRNDYQAFSNKFAERPEAWTLGWATGVWKDMSDFLKPPTAPECGRIWKDQAQVYLAKYDDDHNKPTHLQHLFYDLGGTLKVLYGAEAPRAHTIGLVSARDPKLVEDLMTTISSKPNTRIGGTKGMRSARLLQQCPPAIVLYQPSWYQFWKESQTARWAEYHSLVQTKASFKRDEFLEE